MGYEDEELLFLGYNVSIGEVEKILEMDDDDGSTTSEYASWH